MEIIIADAQSPHIHIIGQINNLLDPVIASIEYLKWSTPQLQPIHHIILNIQHPQPLQIPQTLHTPDLILPQIYMH